MFRLRLSQQQRLLRLLSMAPYFLLRSREMQ
ncbi:hypothetical protein PANA5342_3729 [Pantoea ananatis LMG 5342]|nr:hypothetical protein PANA5342_3729 [Pantoea ananatis LMG 5342]